MKCHQRKIRDEKAQSHGDLFGQWWNEINVSFESSEIREITYQEAAELILEYEWLGNMGTTEYAVGLYFNGVLSGVACFGRTAGTNVNASIAGEKYKDHVITLCRGACAHWAHEHSASYLISRACALISNKYGFKIFVAYSDPEAGEIGTVYQACNWLYVGKTSATEKFDVGDGKIRDSRLVHAYTRDRTGGVLTYKRTRAEQKKIMEENGVRFFKGTPKHRYINVVGNRRERKAIIKSLLLDQHPYPKRDADGVPVQEDRK